MRTYKPVWIGAAVIALVAAILAVLAIAHNRSTAPSPNHGTDSHVDHGEHDPLDPQGAVPDTVARNAMTMIFSWKPSEDESSWDALNRASGLLTGEMAAAAAAPPTPAPRPVPEWAAWARSGDVVSASTVVAPGKTATSDGATSTVPVQISQTVLHPDGDMTPYMRLTGTVNLTNVDGTWLVDSYRIEATG